MHILAVFNKVPLIHSPITIEATTNQTTKNPKIVEMKTKKARSLLLMIAIKPRKKANAPEIAASIIGTIR